MAAQQAQAYARTQKLWKARKTLPFAREAVNKLQNQWFWNRDNSAIATANLRVQGLKSYSESSIGTTIQYWDIHSQDESVL